MGNESSQHIENAQKTGVLQMRNFKLLKVPNEIEQIGQFLRNLDLSNNKIQILPQTLFLKMNTLKNLNLSNNRIGKMIHFKINFNCQDCNFILIPQEILPNEISSLVKLETLNLSENFLQKIPNSFSHLKNLKQINLSKNNLIEIPKELNQIKQLDHLDLSCNRITSIEDSVENLNCIELNLNENRVKSISAKISKCPRLKVVRLEQNVLELKSIPSSILIESNVSLICLDGNLFTQKQLETIEGYEKVSK